MIETVHQNRIQEQKAPQGDDGAQTQSLLSRILSGVLFADLLLLFFGAPLFFTTASLQGVHFDRSMFFIVLVLIALVFWIVRGAVDGRLRIARTPVDIPLMVFWATYVLATLFSIDRWHSFVGQFIDPSRGLLLLTASIILYFIVGSTQTAEKTRVLFSVFAASLGVQALWSAFVLYGGLGSLSENILRFVPVSFMDSVPSQALVLALSVPVFVTAALQMLSRQRARILRYGFLALMTGALVSNVISLAALHLYVPWVAVLVGTGFFAAYLMGNVVLAPKGWQWTGVALFLLMSTLLIIGPDLLARVPFDATSRHYVRDSWEIAKAVVSENVAFGLGPGTYMHAFSQHYPAEWNLSPNFVVRFSESPSVFIGMMIATGAVGTLAFIAALLTAIAAGLYLLMQRSGRKEKIVSLGAWSAALIFFVASTTYAISGAAVIVGTLAIILAVSLVLRESDVQKRFIAVSLRAKPQYALASSFVLMASGLGAIFLFVFITKMIVADFYAGNALRDAEMERNTRIELLGKSLELNGREGRYYMYVGTEIFENARELLLMPEESRDMATAQQLLQGSLQALKQGRDLLPGNVLAQELVAQAYEAISLHAKDGPAEGRGQYMRAIYLEPSNPVYHVKIAQLALLEAGRIEDEGQRNDLLGDAEKHLNQALELNPVLSVAYHEMGIIHEIRGDVDESVTFFERAVQFGRDIQSALSLARAYKMRGEEGDIQRAERVLEQIIGVNDKEVNARLGLAEIYEDTGRLAESISAYEEARDLLPETAENAREQINTLIDAVRRGSVSENRDDAFQDGGVEEKTSQEEGSR